MTMAVLLIGLTAALAPARADPDASSIYDMSLDELLNLEITVASKSTLTTRESPGIVTMITREEILDSGARDLLDVLRRVPGFEFGVDVQGVVGIGTRGLWGHEGKILLLIDGQEMNETLYSNLQFGNHYPLDSIERIEIIRGPGSAMYGGYAELGVIKVITSNGADIDGTRATLDYGRLVDSEARRSLSVSTGRSRGDLDYSVHGLLGEGVRSDRVYSDVWDTSYEMKDNAELDPLQLNFGLAYRNLQARVLYDRYSTTSRDFYDEAFTRPVRCDFTTLSASLSLEQELGGGVTVTPELSYKRQTPWHVDDVSADVLENDDYFAILAERLTARATARYRHSDTFDLSLGGEYMEDRAGGTPGEPVSLRYVFSDGGTEVKYHNIAGFAQAMFRTGAGNFTVGARLEDHCAFGTSFVPRAAYTRVSGGFHAKLLLSKAFRAPSIMGLDYNDALRPEKTRVIEVETGYKLTRRSILTANVFDIAIDDVIVFYYDVDTETEGYNNFDQVANRGLEIEYRFQTAGGSLGANYSYYRNRENLVADYVVPGRDHVLLAFPAHKVNLFGTIDLGGGYSLGSTITCFSKRYGFDGVDENDDLVVSTFTAEALANIWLRAEDFVIAGLDCGIGVHDLLGENHVFVQPYSGYHAPLPGPSREFHLRATYRPRW